MLLMGKSFFSLGHGFIAVTNYWRVYPVGAFPGAPRIAGTLTTFRATAGNHWEPAGVLEVGWLPSGYLT